MAQMVNRRPLTAEFHLRSRVSPCDVRGEQTGKVTCFSVSILYSPVSNIPPTFGTHLHLDTTLTGMTRESEA
jgi:hypothetical protein